MSEPWTPGPWTLDPIWPAVSAGQYGICENIEGPCDHVTGVVPNDYDARANARLISLAPEMAELLERFVSGVEEAGPEMVWAIYVSAHENAARSLLARARGEDAPPIPEDTVQEEGTLQGGS